MNLRHLGYMIALAREGNFRRAAEACHITQPTLSAALRQLENELGTPLVSRARGRFETFTPEGRKVLEWARQIGADVEALRQSLSHVRGSLSGHLRIGIIPTAEPLAGELSAAFLRTYPEATISFLSKTSREIERALNEHTIEAGISYTDGPPTQGLTVMPMYAERYVLLGTRTLLAGRRSITWANAARLPLVLLNREMQNRRLVDGHFAEAGVIPVIVGEANTLVGVLSHVRQSQWCAIVPRTFATLIGGVSDLRAIPVMAPDAAHSVGLITAARQPLPPLTAALIEVLRATPLASLA